MSELLAHGPTSRVHRPAGRALGGQPSVRAVEPFPNSVTVALTPSRRRAHDAAGVFPFVESLFAATRRNGATTHALERKDMHCAVAVKVNTAGEPTRAGRRARTRRPTTPGELALPPTASRSLGHPGRRDPSFREGLLQSLDTRRADPRLTEVEAFQGLESRQRLDRGIRQLGLGQRQVLQ